MSISPSDFDRLVDQVVAKVLTGALGLSRIWAGFAARLKEAFRRHGREIDDLIELEGRAAGRESGVILSATAREVQGLGRNHAWRILSALVRRPVAMPDGRPPDLGPYADRVASAVVARLTESLRTWRDQAHAEEQIVQLTGEHLGQLLTGNQTESFRRYRGSLMEGYRAVPEVDRIVRRERLDSATCALCWALHGEVLSKFEDLAVHPNCRGVPFPVLAGEVPPGPSGPEAFEDLEEAEKREILGKSRYVLYASGQLRLGQLVVRGDHPEFGPFVRGKTLRELESENRQASFMQGEGGQSGSEDTAFDAPEGVTPGQFVRMIRDEDKEVLGVFMGDRLLYARSGSRTRVHLDTRIDHRGALAIHNHPDDKPVSPSDVLAHADHGLKESWVVMRKSGAIFRIVMPSDVDGAHVRSALADAERNARDDLREEAEELARLGRPMGIDMADERLGELLAFHRKFQFDKLGVIIEE